MKKLTSIILTLTLLLSVIVVSAYADNDVQTVFGETTSMFNDSYGSKYIISTETGTDIEAYADDGVSLLLGIYALFTIETRTNGEKYITSYEKIPEYGYEIGYLAGVRKDSFLDEYNVLIYTDKKEEMLVSNRVWINGVRYSGDDIITSLTPQVENFIAYKLDEEGDIRDIVFVDIKTPKEKYNITSDTRFFINTGNYYQIGDLPDGFNYSYEVLSYDKNYNARAVKITELSKTGIAFYSHSLGIHYMVDANGEDKQAISMVTADGEKKYLYLNEDCIIPDTVTAENFDGIIEYKINKEYEITEMMALTGNDFNGYIVKDGKIGENVIADTAIFEVIDNNNSIEHRHNWTYSKFRASDKLQYCGKIYTSSYGKRIIWISDSEPAAGYPIVKFWSRALVDGYNSRFRVGATYEKNGYTGSGTIYLAIYYKEGLHAIYTYSLSDAESIYNEEYKELEDVIRENVQYDVTTDINDYTVKGFVWYDNLAPIYPAALVNIKQ